MAVFPLKQHMDHKPIEVEAELEADISFPKKPDVAEIAMDEENLKLQGETAAIEQESHDNPEIAALPLQVRQLINLTDDPALPTITFRYFVLSALFVIPGAFLSQMSYFRTTKAPYSVFFVQIACHYVGHFLARTHPAWGDRIAGDQLVFQLESRTLEHQGTCSGHSDRGFWSDLQHGLYSHCPGRVVVWRADSTGRRDLFNGCHRVDGMCFCSSRKTDPSAGPGLHLAAGADADNII